MIISRVKTEKIWEKLVAIHFVVKGQQQVLLALAFYHLPNGAYKQCLPFVGEMRRIPPVHGHIFKLVRINHQQNTHGVNNHRPPYWT